MFQPFSSSHECTVEFSRPACGNVIALMAKGMCALVVIEIKL